MPETVLYPRYAEPRLTSQLESGPHSALIYFHQQVLESFPEADILLLKFRRFERKSSRTGL